MWLVEFMKNGWLPVPRLRTVLLAILPHISDTIALLSALLGMSQPHELKLDHKYSFRALAPTRVCWLDSPAPSPSGPPVTALVGQAKLETTVFGVAFASAAETEAADAEEAEAAAKDSLYAVFTGQSLAVG